MQIRLFNEAESSAEKCRRNGWGPGTRLVGDEGFGPTVIEITAVGGQMILAKTVSHNGKPAKYTDEGLWTLSCREWELAPQTVEGREARHEHRL